MKRKFSSIVWAAIVINVVAVVAMFSLAYSAGRWSGGLSMLDFGALPSVAGFRLWTAALATVVAILTLFWLATRTLNPLEQLLRFAQNFDAPEAERPALPGTNDDFEAIAEQLLAAADRLAAATADRQRLAALEDRIAAFAVETRQVSQGDLALRIAETDGTLGEAFTSINAALELIGRVLDSARALAESGAASAEQSVTCGQQVTRTLLQQQSELEAATRGFDVLPHSIKQVQDSSDALTRATQAASGATSQGRQAAAGVSGDLQQLAASLRTTADVLANIRQAAEQATARLRALSAVTERANLLALNAAIEAARAGQAGRTSWVFAEQFRDLAQQSNSAGAELESLLENVQRDGAAAATSLESNVGLAQNAGQEAARAAQAAETGATALAEAMARADVIGIAAARQADAARTVTSTLQSTADLEQLAALKARQASSIAEGLVKLHAELNSALGVLRSAPGPGMTARARAVTTQE